MARRFMLTVALLVTNLVVYNFAILRSWWPSPDAYHLFIVTTLICVVVDIWAQRGQIPFTSKGPKYCGSCGKARWGNDAYVNGMCECPKSAICTLILGS